MNASARLSTIKWIHTLIWAFFAGLILHILWSGLTGRITRFTWIAVGLIIGECLVLLLFRYACPLTVLARKYSDSERANFDIYLPEWLARHNKVIFGSLFLAGLTAVLIRTFVGS